MDQEHEEFRPNRFFLELIVGAGFTRKKSKIIYNSLITHIANALASGDSVTFKGFGTFHAGQRTYRALPGSSVDKPELDIPETVVKTVLFRAGRALKYLVEEQPITVPAEPAGATLSALRALNDSAREEYRRAQFDIHYNTGIAFKEMGLYDEAIRELEQAITLVNIEDRENRFVHCCSLLGLCHSANGTYAEAERWLLKGLDYSARSESEYKALRYDLGLVYEAWGKVELASEAFCDVYAIDLNFRKIGQKIKTLQSRYIRTKRGERKAQLIPVQIRGRDAAGQRFEEETLIINISRRGAGLRTNRALAPGTYVELHFPSAQRVKVAKVVWCAPVHSPEGGFQAGMLVYHEPPKG